MSTPRDRIAPCYCSKQRGPRGVGTLYFLLLFFVSAAAPVNGLEAAPLIDAHEGPESAWRLPRGGGVRLIQQQRMRIDRDEQSSGVEWLRYTCRPGYTAQAWRPIGRAPVLDELAVSVAVRCEAPGAVLAARVVLPRSIDAKTGRPKTGLLRGGRYTAAGQWQTLTLADTPRLTAGAARLMRTEPGAALIDERGAYVDRVVLLLPGAASPIGLWLDDLEVRGVLLESSPDDTDASGVALPDTNSPQPAADQRVLLNASGFSIGGRPFFPRVWSYAGGAIEAVRKAGFNTIAFDQPPTTKQLAESARHKLRVICPPPEAARIDVSDWAPVLAWRVGGGPLDAARAFADRIRRVDLALQRPIIARVDGDWSAWSRIVDGLVIQRNGPRSPAADRLWTERVRDVTRLARPGTPLIQVVTAAPNREASRQLAVLASLDPNEAIAADDQIAADAWSAIINRAAAVWVIGDQRLSSADAASVRLRRGLTLFNLWLELVNPWLAGGTRGVLVADTTGTPRAMILKRGRVQLLAPLPRQNAPPAGARLVIPGGGGSTQAYRLTPTGVQPVRADRVAGGTAVNASTLGPWSMALLTEDRPAVSAINRRAQKTAEQAVRLQLEIARDELSRFNHQQADGPAAASPLRRRAEQSISLANAAAAAQKLPQAFASVSAARGTLARGVGQPGSDGDTLLRTPLALAPGGGQTDRQLALLLAGAPRGANLLAGGDFEDLDQTRRAGWTNTTLSVEGLNSGVELSTQSPGHGRRALRLATGVEGDAPFALAAGDCPVWVTSPATELATGQLVEVIGWVRLEPEKTSDHPPRLIISDTLGGEQLGRVVDRAETWRPFRLLRRAPHDAELRVTFGLSGVGAALVDAVMVRPVQVGAAPRPPARLRPAPPVATNPAGKAAAAGRAQR